jgi:hypothetical protein
MKGSRSKYANLVRITHRDEVEAPITDWLREAYDTHDALRKTAREGTKTTKKAAKKRPRKRAR